ncbi:dna-damage-repair toleration protein drt111 [Stylonychia lemnae]|uniref:Dna-damage-repair toleration protein drt111 n=1 Tax=Stylonychia lemnae TaxID=5949 RepID=A0A078ADG6_STYLE|nr:dna-damage-repair toleration protein drt111 [Stylonychia lemnae]|eukprot:CDW78893.1 dna-damage-repair toleration protein drt111 [Stylonychia lemnae]
MSKIKASEEQSELEIEANETLKKLDTRSGLVDIYLGNQADEEYNPANPNDFEKIIGKAKALKKELAARVERERILKKQIEIQQQQLLNKGKLQDEEEEDYTEMTAEEAYQARLRKSQGHLENQDAPQGSNRSDNKIKKMMEAMGWKGKGLGKQEQGILNPLVPKLTDGNAAIIEESAIGLDIMMKNEDRNPAIQNQQFIPVQLPQIRSKVLLFRDLVGIEEVDEDLREEVKFECEKYGEVLTCLVHSVPSEQLVKVFVEYRFQVEADNAYMDFKIREFNNKLIDVDFYGEDLLRQRQFNHQSLNM